MGICIKTLRKLEAAVYLNEINISKNTSVVRQIISSQKMLEFIDNYGI